MSNGTNNTVTVPMVVWNSETRRFDSILKNVQQRKFLLAIRLARMALAKGLTEEDAIDFIVEFAHYDREMATAIMAWVPKETQAG